MMVWRTSRLGALAARVGEAARGSFLYRWLTKEPDPEVIVIDLRETWTVGPILAVLDRTIAALAPALASSGLFAVLRRGRRVTRARPVQVLSLGVGAGAAALVVASAVLGELSRSVLLVAGAGLLLAVVGSRVSWSWEDIAATRGYQLLVAALEPPEPPEREIADPDDERPASRDGTETENESE